MGLDAESMDLARLIRRVYEEVSAIIQPLLPEDYCCLLLPSFEELSINDALPTLVRVFEDEKLAKLLPTVIVIIDALDQLVNAPYDEDSSDRPSDAKWFPPYLPAKLKFVV